MKQSVYISNHCKGLIETIVTKAREKSVVDRKTEQNTSSSSPATIPPTKKQTNKQTKPQTNETISVKQWKTVKVMSERKKVWVLKKWEADWCRKSGLPCLPSFDILWAQLYSSQCTGHGWEAQQWPCDPDRLFLSVSKVQAISWSAHLHPFLLCFPNF